MNVPLRLPAGPGEVSDLDGERLHVISPTPYAPGQRFSGSIQLDGGAVTVEGRSQSSKKREDGRFEVRVRLVNLSRSGRVRLTAALGV